MEDWWSERLAEAFAGRRVVLAGAVAAAWTEHVELLRSAGATELMIVATEGRGVGPVPDLPTVVVDPPGDATFMERIHFGNRMLEEPPPVIVDALDRFDPDGDALVIGTFLNVAPDLAGRPFLAHRRPEWVALEDKVVVDDFWDRAGVEHRPSLVVGLGAATDAAVEVDLGHGTVWAADARDGFHGGAAHTHWVNDETSRRRALEGLAPVCDRVRVMPFLEGIPCSIHGIVLPDGTAALRPVELITLRRGNEFVYAGCATLWDPPGSVRRRMRRIVRATGAQLADEVAFRGAFTVDGVATADGFWPTELNPRFGAGVNTIARASGLPVLMLNELIVAGHDIGRSAAELEDELVAAADARRGGGTWIHGTVDSPTVERRGVTLDGDGFRWSRDGDVATATVTAGAGFVRCVYEAAAIGAGPPTAPIAATFWEFADRELDTDLGWLTPPPDPWG
jgi:hypothetical protein